MSPQLDWDALRARSTRPYGFGEDRILLWPRLLYVNDDPRRLTTEVLATNDAHAERRQKSSGADSTQGTPHADERQIGLDTDRSFVLYPVEETAGREKLQAGLNHLIVSVFRRRPHLHYFQGYHDIVSVLYLTLPQELHLPVTEKISLHRVRDSMGTTLEPVVGLLRILKRLLHLADEKFAESLERAAPLPYYALSNLLTLFSHDIPTLPHIQHIFDYLLSRPPIVVVYLAAALTLTRREEVRILEDEGEEGMMHSLLTGLPDLYEEGEDTITLNEESSESTDGITTQCKVEEPDAQTSSSDAVIDGPLAMRPATPEVDTTGHSVDDATEENSTLIAEDVPLTALESSCTADAQDSNSLETASGSSSDLTVDPTVEITTEKDDMPSTSAEPQEPSVSEIYISRTTSPEPFEPTRPHRPRVSLTTLLTHADELFALYPPTHPAIDISSIMGPQSAMITWSERRAELPDDDEAELMVTKPELVVLPHVEPDDDVASDGDSFNGPGRREGRGHEKDKDRRQRRLRKPRRLTDLVVQRKTMVAGAVLVLGVAMAVYGYNAGLPGSGGGHHRSGFGREWRKVGRFLGGALLGAGERVLDGVRRGLE
ncbi:rab-GTPase-TBC domain-containing protein [Trametes meyenii]|nr:rab-GTPase-TBC domain-containing protein [Trametes meyenii]